MAGFLYKPNISYRSKFIADFRRLIIPYLILAFGFTLYLLIKETDKIFALKYSLIATFWATGWNHSSLIWSTAPHIGIAWFLPSLFCCRQIFNYIYTKTKDSRLIFIGLSFTATLIDYYLINLPLGILTGASALIFYLIGYYTHYTKTSKAIPLILGAICWGLQLIFGGIDMCFCYYGFYPIDIIGASFATAIIYYVAKYLSNNNLGRILAYIGKSSLYIYCFHALENVIMPYQWFTFENIWYIEIPVRAAICITAAYIFVSCEKYLQKQHSIRPKNNI